MLHVQWSSRKIDPGSAESASKGNGSFEPAVFERDTLEGYPGEGYLGEGYLGEGCLEGDEETVGLNRSKFVSNWSIDPKKWLQQYERQVASESYKA